MHIIVLFKCFHFIAMQTPCQKIHVIQFSYSSEDLWCVAKYRTKTILRISYFKIKNRCTKIQPYFMCKHNHLIISAISWSILVLCNFSGIFYLFSNLIWYMFSSNWILIATHLAAHYIVTDC